MKKFWAILLVFWPYLMIPLMLVTYILSDGATISPGFLLYCFCTPVTYIANIICACKTANAKSLSFWNMLMKLFHIPAYIIVFWIGIYLTAQPVVGLPLGLLFVPILVLIDVLLLCTTSAYGICALVRSKQEGRISTIFMVVNIILHLIFVWDVISSIIVFFKIRKRKPSA